MRRTDIQIRDPFVLPVPDEGAYYLFGSTDPDIWDGPGIGFGCYRSADLVDWKGPVAAFRPPPGFWSPGCYWAPEVHRYGDAWFMFATFTGADGHRGTQVLRAPRPDGPYEPWSEGPVTPRDWPCLDGTLHVDAGGPWLVFCHEWIQCRDGEVCAMRLASDLRTAVGDVMHLFRGSEAKWSVPFDGAASIADTPGPAFVTDGPFLHRAADGQLLMLWSSFGARGYAMGVARSETGSVLGPWHQADEPIWAADGGHGMLFRALDGQLHLTLHTPNQTPHERALFVPIDEANGRLLTRLGDSPTKGPG
jgi:arabinan endo-1,5-alpha-L-arabinosidase